MKLTFVHEFTDSPPDSDLDVGLDLPPGATIRFGLDGQDIWLTCNRAGWEHLARICAELAGQSQLEPGYHFHRTCDWKDSRGPGEGVSFGLTEDDAVG